MKIETKRLIITEFDMNMQKAYISTHLTKITAVLSLMKYLKQLKKRQKRLNF